MNLLRKAEKIALSYDKGNGYYLAFSGGKDSQALYHVAKLAGVKFAAHMNLTSVDPAPVIRFVKKQYPSVELIKPKMSIFQDAVERKILPTMRVRWCCADFKESAGAGKVTLIGIRHEESSRRARRNEVEVSSRKFSGTLDELDEYREKKTHRGGVNITNATEERTIGCISGKESLLISPIIHWTERNVWEFLNTLEIPHCELYDQGNTRIGCLCCPMSQPKQKLKDIAQYPHIKRNWIKAIKAIRRGRVFKGEYIWWNLRQNQLPPPHWEGNPNPQYYIGGTIMQMFAPHELPKEHLDTVTGGGFWTRQPWLMGYASTAGFSDSSSSDGLTEEQRENLIAEAIFDWWISGKSYKQWYADKYLQIKFDFDNGND